MKLIGSFSLLMFFITSILSFIYMYTNDSEKSFVSSSKFLQVVEQFPRENFDNMIDSWDYFKENVKFASWDDDYNTIANINRMINSIFGSIFRMLKSVFSFIIAFIGYGFDLVIWFLNLPFQLVF